MATATWSQVYNDWLEDSDQRVKGWVMLKSPLPTIAACLFYAYFSKVLGPKLMENRKPFSLQGILVPYNLFQTLFSTYLFYEYMMSGWWGDYSYRCQPVDYSTSPSAMRMLHTCWWFYIAKFTEFFDTLFFVLRKKNSHVSTLHVIHHGIMPFSVWMGLKFAAGGHSTFFAMLNSFVHIVMYFYYMIAAMGPKYQKYIWWKKYLTAFQIVQFVCIFVHQFQLLFSDCKYPRPFVYFIGAHGVLFLFLFSDFYKTKYTKNSSKKNEGLCMAVLDDEGEKKSHRRIGSKGSLSNTYMHFSDGYKPCYSNGINNGFVSQGYNQEQQQSNGKKVD